MKYWITHNEPHETCWAGYGSGYGAPGRTSAPGSEPYMCAHNIIKSHAAVWHAYNDKFRKTQKGELRPWNQDAQPLHFYFLVWRLHCYDQAARLDMLVFLIEVF